MKQLENTVSRYNNIILQDLYEDGITCWIAGGSLRDYFMGEPIKTDHDMFFPDEENYKKAEKYFKIRKCEVKWESDNGMKISYEGRVYDLVKKYFPNPEDTINNFDFTVSMFAVDNKKVYFGETSFIDLAKRQLMINRITLPPSTLSRAFRYYKKGFTMCKVEMKKVIDAIRSYKPENEQEMPDEEISGSNFFRGFD